MQNYNYISENETLEVSRQKLLDNDQTAISNSSGDTPPPSPFIGQTWYDTKNKSMNIFNGDTWEQIGLNILKRSHEYSEGDIAYYSELPSWAYLLCKSTGTTDLSIPSSLNNAVKIGLEIIDGTVTWVVNKVGSDYNKEVSSIIVFSPEGSVVNCTGSNGVAITQTVSDEKFVSFDINYFDTYTIEITYNDTSTTSVIEVCSNKKYVIAFSQQTNK